VALTVNRDPHPWHEGLTVAGLLEEKRFLFPMKIVFVNGELVQRGEYDAKVLADGDAVEVMHLTGGG
jgi:sulfur carrier protein